MTHFCSHWDDGTPWGEWCERNRQRRVATAAAWLSEIARLEPDPDNDDEDYDAGPEQNLETDDLEDLAPRTVTEWREA